MKRTRYIVTESFMRRAHEVGRKSAHKSYGVPEAYTRRYDMFPLSARIGLKRIVEWALDHQLELKKQRPDA